MVKQWLVASIYNISLKIIKISVVYKYSQLYLTIISKNYKKLTVLLFQPLKTNLNIIKKSQYLKKTLWNTCLIN